MIRTQDYDILVIGTGLAGLTFALKAAENTQVALVTKGKMETGNSLMAQGGIAAVMSPDDSLDQHIKDTITAGAGLCRPHVVKEVVSQGPDRIDDLLNWGVEFDRNTQNEFSLGKEGGHQKRRILHIQDHTGLDIHRQLQKQVLEHPKIKVIENHLAIDLISSNDTNPFEVHQQKCFGAYFLNLESDQVTAVTAKKTVLATGGAGKVYLYTSNWSGATGDGIAMAHRAGARVANLEFMQFHPTCLYHPFARNFLVSEAVRGEGGELINEKGEAFMKKHHDMGSLAPRDIVARSIDAEMKRSGADCVYIDITDKSEGYLKDRFPLIHKRCMDHGVDISKDPIPVVPAAHYLCGGVITDMNGRTDIDSLYALGETGCTGLHGANRLASNSLLECLVFSHNAAEDIQRALADSPPSPEIEIPPWSEHNKQDADEMIVVSHMWDEIRHLMWNYVGIVRTNRRLERAQHRLTNILNELQEYYSNFRVHADLIELRNIALVADLTVKCALRRRHSLGIHYNLDYPFLDTDQFDPQDNLI